MFDRLNKQDQKLQSKIQMLVEVWKAHIIVLIALILVKFISLQMLFQSWG